MLSVPAAALLTPRGRGAVATIEFRGDCGLLDLGVRALFRAANGKPLTDQPMGRIVFGRWGSEHELSEEVVVCRRNAETVEIHCHGGEAAARRILGDLERVGSKVQPWQAQLASFQGVFDAECTEALSNALTERTADFLLEQAGGTLRQALERLHSHSWGDAQRGELQRQIAEMLHWSQFGLHLTRPWSVVVTGRPNVGKSSLINALLGYARSIVFDQPGTTRDVVTAETAFAGWPVQLADTAGIRQAEEALESAGIERARQRLAAADCRLVVLDPSRPPERGDAELLEGWPDALVVANKADLPDEVGAAVPQGALRVSSLTGVGVESLIETIANRLVPCVPDQGIAFPITRRQVQLLARAAEAIDAEDECLFRTWIAEILG